MGKQTFIEINGKKYDAVTGKMISQQQTTYVKKSTTIQKGVGVVDGFARRPTKLRSPAAHVSKRPQRSQTLMRTGLKKPSLAPRKKSAKTHPTISKASLGTSARRQQTAKTVHKSPRVKKFDHTTKAPIIKKTAPIAPKPVPAHSKKPGQLATKHVQTASHTKLTVPSSRKTSAAMIDKALANATSHTQQAPEHTKHIAKKRHSKLRKKMGISRTAASFGSAAIAVVLLAGFFTIQNVPNLSMRIAAARAGFDASMPGYQPSGFSFNGPINYNAGRVTVSFTSNTDNRTYDLTQRSSNWTSDALLANYIETENKQYQTFLDKGRTLYLYDGSNATWVDDGIWYQIEGDSDLTTDQLVRIASSL